MAEASLPCVLLSKRLRERGIAISDGIYTLAGLIEELKNKLGGIENRSKETVLHLQGAFFLPAYHSCPARSIYTVYGAVEATGSDGDIGIVVGCNAYQSAYIGSTMIVCMEAGRHTAVAHEHLAAGSAYEATDTGTGGIDTAIDVEILETLRDIDREYN